MRTIRIALIGWVSITLLIALQFVWVYSRHGLAGFQNYMQEAPYTHIPITLASVSMTWLLAGLLLALILGGRITRTSAPSWAGFFAIAFLYLNILRERVRYGDIDYYTQAAFALLRHQPLPDTYFYPPLWATLLSFLAPFEADGILLIAWIANVLSLLLFYFLLQRTLELYQFSRPAAALTAALFILVNMPVLRTLMYVQVNFHVMNFILLSLLLYKDRIFLSALMLALAVHFKASPAVLVLAFLLDFNWKWLIWFVISLVAIAGLTVAIYGTGPYYDFIHNFLFISAPHALSMHDSSFDSAIGMALSYLRADPNMVSMLVLFAKGITGLAAILLAVRSQGFFSAKGANAHLLNSIVPLFPAMTLLSPLVWEHHALFLALPYLLLLKKLETSAEWVSFGTAYLLVFLVPTFDYFPWSYGRLVGMLILFILLWKTIVRTGNSFFPRANTWADDLVHGRTPAKTA